MSVAGIWGTWHRGLPDERQSFSIITTAANAFMREIHDRMPLILGRSQEDAWLDPEIRGQETLQKLFQPCPSSWLTAVEISPLVNSPKNNTPAVLQPIVAAKASDERVLRLFD